MFKFLKEKISKAVKSIAEKLEKKEEVVSEEKKEEQNMEAAVQEAIEQPVFIEPVVLEQPKPEPTHELPKEETVVEKIEFSSSDNLVLASVSVSSYWAKIPGKLPNFSDPIEKLAEVDMAALEIMSQLTPPAFSDLVPSGPSARTNPFD